VGYCLMGDGGNVFILGKTPSFTCWKEFSSPSC